MPTTSFPSNTPQRVRLPTPQTITPLLGQTPSWRTIFGKEVVDIYDPNVNPQAADSEGYFPINAIYLEDQGCKISQCEDATLFINDGMSRCAFWLNEATILPPVGQAPVQQIIDFAIKVATAAIPNTVAHFSALITTGPSKTQQNTEGGRSPVRGMICEVSGLLVTQFEVWARVRNIGPSPLSQPVEVRLMFTADRLGSQIFAMPGNVILPPPGSDIPLPCCTGLTGPTGLTGS
jgi:hypothetical protein